MLRLDLVKELHVIKKIEEIVGKWFNIDLVFTDQYGKVNWDTVKNKEAYYSYLFKHLIQHRETQEQIQEDLTKAIDHLEISKQVCFDFHTFLPYVKATICQIADEQGVSGYLVAYCYTNGIFTKEDAQTVQDKLVSYQLMPEEAQLCISRLAKLEIIQGEYLKELLKLYSEEIKTYHEEILKREDIINDLHSEVSKRYRYHEMIGKSQPMQTIYRLLEKIAHSESTIMIQGENGTGKELVAKAI